MGEIVIRTTHRVQRIDPERSRVTYRMEISGARSGQFEPQIGPEISGDFPQTPAELIARRVSRSLRREGSSQPTLNSAVEQRACCRPEPERFRLSIEALGQG
jgi:hypothetical protein